MLVSYYKSATAVTEFECGPAAPFLDGFAESLKQRGYSGRTIRYHAGATHHLCCWMDRKGVALATLDEGLGRSFLQHLPSCRCPVNPPGRFVHHARFSVPLFIGYLREIGRLQAPDPTPKAPEPILLAFRHWMLHHRGVTESTLILYDRLLPSLLRSVDGEVGRLHARALRDFFRKRTKDLSPGSAKNEANAIRTFVRFLIAEGRVPPGLDAALPPLAGWRRVALPRHLSGSEIDCLLAACDPSTRAGLRDRAVVLLLLRLGLRASDVSNLRLGDISWREAGIRVSGKGRRQVRLPLPQEVGDAILAYLEQARPPVATDHLFIRVKPPLLPLRRGNAVSTIATAAMKRAGIRSPSPGSHVLRHTAAAQMLRAGLSLQEIGTVLRHRLLETTHQYAKVDYTLLQQMVKPWPEVRSC